MTKQIRMKQTNENIDVRRIRDGRTFTRVGNVINATTHIEWKCNVCTKTWMATPDAINSRKTGCIHCVKKTRLTNDIIDERLLGRGILRMDSVINNKTPMKWKCMKCENIWQTTTDKILNDNTGCPKCNKPRQHSKMAHEWLKQLQTNLQVEIQSAIVGGEFQIPGTRYKVDGYSKDLNTVFEFYGDDWHGNINKHAPTHKCHPFNDRTAIELYAETLQREEIIRQKGFNVVSIWESEYKRAQR